MGSCAGVTIILIYEANNNGIEYMSFILGVKITDAFNVSKAEGDFVC